MQLNPAAVFPPRWMSFVPSILLSPELVGAVVERRLSSAVLSRTERAGIEITSQRLVETREWFPSPRDVYLFLTWARDEQDVPAYEDVAPSLERVFRDHAGSTGLEYSRAGFIWEGRVLARAV